MSLDNLIAGDHGQVIELTIVDTDTEEAADVSGYNSAIQMIFRKPDGSSVTKTAQFKTDGTDGVIRYAIDEDFLTAGNWRVRGMVQSSGAELTTVWHDFRVLS